MPESADPQLAADLAVFDRAVAAGRAELAAVVAQVVADEHACRWWLAFSARCAPDTGTAGRRGMKQAGAQAVCWTTLEEM